MSADNEFFRNLLWRHLSVPDLILYCKTNSEYLKICEQKQTWQYLLERDFKIKEKAKDPRKKYFKIVLDEYAQNAFLDAKNKQKRGGNVSYFYEIVLAAKGIGENIGNLFGNKVGAKLWDTLTIYNRSGTSPLHYLFGLAGLEHLL